MLSPEHDVHPIPAGIVEREPALSRQRKFKANRPGQNKSTPDAFFIPSERDDSNAEFYGYSLYLMSIFAFLLYLAWAYVPNAYLDAMGWTYYPDKKWAVAIPAFLFLLLFFALGYHASYILYHTPSLDSFNIITDECVSVLDPDSLNISYDKIDDLQVQFEPYSVIPSFEDVPLPYVSPS